MKLQKCGRYQFNLFKGIEDALGDTTRDTSTRIPARLSNDADTSATDTLQQRLITGRDASPSSAVESLHPHATTEIPPRQGHPDVSDVANVLVKQETNLVQQAQRRPLRGPNNRQSAVPVGSSSASDGYRNHGEQQQYPGSESTPAEYRHPQTQCMPNTREHRTQATLNQSLPPVRSRIPNASNVDLLYDAVPGIYGDMEQVFWVQGSSRAIACLRKAINEVKLMVSPHLLGPEDFRESVFQQLSLSLHQQAIVMGYEYFPPKASILPKGIPLPFVKQHLDLDKLNFILQASMFIDETRACQIAVLSQGPDGMLHIQLLPETKPADIVTNIVFLERRIQLNPSGYGYYEAWSTFIKRPIPAEQRNRTEAELKWPGRHPDKHNIPVNYNGYDLLSIDELMTSGKCSSEHFYGENLLRIGLAKGTREINNAVNALLIREDRAPNKSNTITHRFRRALEQRAERLGSTYVEVATAYYKTKDPNISDEALAARIGQRGKAPARKGSKTAASARGGAENGDEDVVDGRRVTGGE